MFVSFERYTNYYNTHKEIIFINNILIYQHFQNAWISKFSDEVLE